MSVSVDTVYKTVLLILNKEQRGYMTPDEFNRIGSQVQREIFERYFEDIISKLEYSKASLTMLIEYTILMVKLQNLKLKMFKLLQLTKKQ